jgi:hypothetical protein
VEFLAVISECQNFVGGGELIITNFSQKITLT